MADNMLSAPVLQSKACQRYLTVLRHFNGGRLDQTGVGFAQDQKVQAKVSGRVG
jgi:hypothetical protein